MGLDYGHTCGEIDSDIEDFKTIIEDSYFDLLDEVCPLIEGKQKIDLIKRYVANTYGESQGIFENVRKCNEDMRQEADRQIDDADEKVEEIGEEVNEKQERVEELESELALVEDRCADLEAENRTLQEEV